MAQKHEEEEHGRLLEAIRFVTVFENQLISITGQRNAIAAQMSALLGNAAFNGQPINEQQAKQLIAQGQALLNVVNAM